MPNRITSYKQLHSRKRRRVPWSLLVVLPGVIVFVLLLFWFRGSRTKPALENELSEELTPVLKETESTQQTLASDSPLEEIDLYAVSVTPASGIARREVKDGIYRHSVKAQLPEPPPLVIEQNESTQEIEQYYEGWLVRQSPFAFFSTGEMTTNSNGDYVLEWTGQEGQTFSNYNQVVITIEPRDNDPAPAVHILEGEF